jgi:hypothetical protein
MTAQYYQMRASGSQLDPSSKPLVTAGSDNASAAVCGTEREIAYTPLDVATRIGGK